MNLYYTETLNKYVQSYNCLKVYVRLQTASKCIDICKLQHTGVHTVVHFSTKLYIQFHNTALRCTYNCTLRHKGLHTTAQCRIKVYIPFYILAWYIYLHVGVQLCTFKCKLQHKSTQCANNCTRQHKSVHCTYNCTLQHKCKHTTANSTLQCKDCTMRYNCMFKYKLLTKVHIAALRCTVD